MADVLDSPTRSTGISNILSKGRSRGKKTKDSPSGSVNSLEANHPGGRGSSETIETKGHDGDNDSNGIKKLMPSGLKSKRRRKKQELEDEQRASEEVARGRTVAERGTLADGTENSHLAGDDTSSLTDDSDGEPAYESRPPLSSHPSHSGYLTTSSPLIQSTTLADSNEGAGAGVDGATTPRPSVFPPLDAQLQGIGTITTITGNSLAAPIDDTRKRAPSPVGKIKGALRRKRSSTAGKLGVENEAGRGTAGPQEKETAASRLHEKNSSQASISSGSASPERPRTAKLQLMDVSAIQTPSWGEKIAPQIVNTPPTPVDHQQPQFPSRDRGSSDPASNNSPPPASPPQATMSHRRARSGSATLGPSKLSTITNVPLSPTPENAPSTPPDSQPTQQYNPQGGFFSSVFSAAQTAASTFSNSISNTAGSQGGSRKSIIPEVKKEVENPEVETLLEKSDMEQPVEEKELAVKTMGTGDLSLSHLGIPEGVSTPIASFADEHAFDNYKDEEDFGSRQTESVDLRSSSFEENHPPAQPRPVYESSIGDLSPPNGHTYEPKPVVHRANSIRSSTFPRRKRGTSSSAGGAIGAAIAAANASLANPIAQPNTPKITGFAVASKKRNRDFHQLFKSVPDDDYLIEDYSCAFQREILAHGRLYVSEGHLCFSSNIFGWVTTLVMSFDEIVSIEKRSTALVFKNGLMISTLHAKNIFASFTSRDSTYDLIVGIWKLGHPSLRSSLNGVRLDDTGSGDKTEKIDGNGAAGSQSDSESESESDGNEEVYDEDEDEDGSLADGDDSVAGSEAGGKAVVRKPSNIETSAGVSLDNAAEGAAGLSDDFPGPATHAPSECTDKDTHFTKVIMDEIIPAPLGKTYSILFGPASMKWMRDFFLNNQKCYDLTLDDKSPPLDNDHKSRSYQYIKPLYAALGPSKTKCICTETLEYMDLEKAVSITILTQTPEVPSGNIFSVKTKYCLTWAPGNNTRILANCTVEWTGKSWLKSPIEKACNEGQVLYAKDIFLALKQSLSSRRPGAAVPVAGGKKGKKGKKAKGAKSESINLDGAIETKPEPVAKQSALGQVMDIVKPMISMNLLYGGIAMLLFTILFTNGWLPFSRRQSPTTGGISGLNKYDSPQRIAAYEELWRREESELWDWIEERAGMEKLRTVGRMPIESKIITEKIKNERMSEREVDAAIKVTEERLSVLKDVMQKKKQAAGPSARAGEELAEPSIGADA